MEYQVDGSNLILRPVCPICGKRSKLRVKFDDFVKYQNGELIQNCFPYLTKEDREMLLSGMCKDCWDNAFADTDEIWHK